MHREFAGWQHGKFLAKISTMQLKSPLAGGTASDLNAACIRELGAGVLMSSEGLES